MLCAVRWFLVSVCACTEIDGYYRRVSSIQHVLKLVWTPHSLASRYRCSGEARLWDQADVKVELLTFCWCPSVWRISLVLRNIIFFNVIQLGFCVVPYVYSTQVILLSILMIIHASLLELL